MAQTTPIPLEEIHLARDRLSDLAVRTPLLRLDHDGETEIYIKLENLQPIGSFKIRGAGNAIRSADPASLRHGILVPSAGNMAQGVGYCATRMNLEWTAVVPDHAPEAKLEAIRRLRGEVVSVSFERWWQVVVERRFENRTGLFVHPFHDPAVMAGNGTIGLEILEDLPDVDTILVPWGGGGLSCGIASAIQQLKPSVRVLACEVETAAPLSASLAAGEPVRVDYTPSFVDGIGAAELLPEMWPQAQALLAGALVVSLEEVAEAVRILVRRARSVAEGAGAAPVAAALSGSAGSGKIACVVSGGNLDPAVLAAILEHRPIP